MSTISPLDIFFHSWLQRTAFAPSNTMHCRQSSLLPKLVVTSSCPVLALLPQCPRTQTPTNKESRGEKNGNADTFIWHLIQICVPLPSLFVDMWQTMCFVLYALYFMSTYSTILCMSTLKWEPLCLMGLTLRKVYIGLQPI